MTKIHRFLSALIIMTFLASCGGRSIGTLYEFDGTKDYGLITYDIYFVGEITPNYALYFFPYDPESKTINIDKRTSTGCGFICARGNEGIQFYIGTIEPGSYVAGYLFYASNYQKRFVCFPQQTIQVDIKPGVTHYLGEMTFTMDHPIGRSNAKLEVTPHDLDHVRARLAKYPRVLAVDRYRRPDGKLRNRISTKPDAEIEIVPIRYVSYDPGERKRDMSCVKDYVD